MKGFVIFAIFSIMYVLLVILFNGKSLPKHVKLIRKIRKS